MLSSTTLPFAILRANFLQIILPSILITWFVAHTIRSYRRLSHIPGPFLAKFTNFQRVFWVKSMRSHEYHQRAHKQYGDLVQIGPNTVSVGNPDAIPALYPMRPGVPKGLFYRAFIPYTKGGSLPAIFTTQDEQLHKKLKTPVAPMYSLSNVLKLEGSIDDTLELLFRQLDERFVASQRTFDLGNWLQYFAFEVMGTMTFSSWYGFLETGQDVDGILASIWGFMLTIAPMTQIPWLDYVLHKSDWTAWLRRKPAASSILKVVSQNIDERSRKAKSGVDIGHNDFLSQFFQIQSSDHNVPPWAVRAWTFSNVIAGSDSTAAVMKTLMYNLLTHRSCLRRVQKELLVREESKMSRPLPQWDQISNLPYLDACFQEAVRLIPPFSLQLERVIPKGGLVLCGEFLEEGTVVGMNPWVVNRHAQTFGEDVDAWRPNRWLVDDASVRRKMENSVMTFGAGRRICMGKALATMEIKKIAAALVLNYEIDLPNPDTYHAENSYFFKQTGIEVKLKRATST